MPRANNLIRPLAWFLAAAVFAVTLSPHAAVSQTDPGMPELAVPLPTRTGPRIAPAPVNRFAEQIPRSPFGVPCALRVSAEPAIGAMVRLKVEAPCAPATPIAIDHEGLTWSAITSPAGILLQTVPALIADARYHLRFADGITAEAETRVPEAADYVRVAVMWRGGDLALHAYEYGAGPGRAGHIHAGNPYVPNRGANLGRGYLTRFDPASPKDIQVEIFSFPAAAAQRSGQIALRLLARATPETCGTRLPLRLLSQSGPGQSPQVEAVTLFLPVCGGPNDVLVLKNLVPPVKVAVN